jgi:hypothetical protein
MRLITVELVHADGRIVKVNANEVPAWNSRGFSIPKEGKTSGGEPGAEQPKLSDEQPAEDKNLNDIII